MKMEGDGVLSIHEAFVLMFAFGTFLIALLTLMLKMIDKK
ncbi:putative holin-like toxin [Virgibacillus byunsanensis]|uniref:Holin-like toxin n=1 Tax=Virgibacillus byunsanensis TaxID=570945 RepID=A0ABW3LG29_9BACI